MPWAPGPDRLRLRLRLPLSKALQINIYNASSPIVGQWVGDNECFQNVPRKVPVTTAVLFLAGSYGEQAGTSGRFCGSAAKAADH